MTPSSPGRRHGWWGLSANGTVAAPGEVGKQPAQCRHQHEALSTWADSGPQGAAGGKHGELAPGWDSVQPGHLGFSQPRTREKLGENNFFHFELTLSYDKGTIQQQK